MTLVVAPCPICDGVNHRPLYAATIPLDANDAAAYCGSSRIRAGHLPIVQCAGCGLVMTNPQDDSGTLARVYAAHVDAAYELEYENRRRAAERHLRFVAGYQARPGRILDIGCATGIFARAAQKSGWAATGLDTSEWMVSVARQRCPEATFEVGTLENAAFAPGSFEVITLWDVLEHLSEPLATLRRVREWLVPNGWLFLSLPNRGSAVARIMGKRWPMLLREHLWYFSPATLEKLLTCCEFDLVRTRPKLVRFSLANVLGRLAQYPTLMPEALGRMSRISMFRRIRLLFPMGEIDVAAKARG